MLTLLSAHQALHTGVLYKHIHKIHHKYSAPFGLAAEYAHPAEVFILGAGTICGPLLYCYFTQNLHIFTVYLWIVLRLFQAVDAHSGYDFPWSLHNIVPFWSGAEHHDFHHMAFTNNFSTSFRWWDYMLGTDDKYRAYRARVKAMKKKGMTAEEQREVERKLMDEVEKEGIAAEHYHAGMTDEDRKVVYMNWKSNRTQVMVATVREHRYSLSVDAHAHL